MSEIKLLPCPFCGGEAKILYNRLRIGHYAKGGTFRVHCKKCGITTEGKKDKNKAIEQWNTRKPMERIIERLEEIKKNLVVNASSDYLAIHYALAIDSTIKVVKEEGGIE